MRVKLLPLFVIMAFMTSSLSGCMGLLQARESLEGLRGDSLEVEYLDKVTMVHTFTTLEIAPYLNDTTFSIDSSVKRIEIYFKVAISGSDQFSCLENFTRYVRAEVIKPSDSVLWSVDVCEDVSPTVYDFESSPVFEYGDWILDVEARGWGETTLGTFQDDFIIIINIYRECIQYPEEPPCEE